MGVFGKIWLPKAKEEGKGRVEHNCLMGKLNIALGRSEYFLPFPPFPAPPHALSNFVSRRNKKIFRGIIVSLPSVLFLYWRLSNVTLFFFF